jgi:ribosomal protein L18
MPGWFDFINGQTLPASRVQEYLMDQSVMKFADSGSRAAALPFPTDGMVSYLTDIDRLFVYRSSSSAWVQIAESTNLAALSAALPTRRNAIINGAFDIWQRGTTFNAVTTGTFFADRWLAASVSGTQTINVTQQTFTPGSAPMAGNEGQYFMRIARTVSSSGAFYLDHKIEDVRTLAGQTVTLSFWARVSSGTLTPNRVFLNQNFGSGGSAETDNIGAFFPTITTTWQRFTQTIALPSIAGKTLGAGNYLRFLWELGSGLGNFTLDLWGVQLEAGSVATPFARAATTLQGELAACQRYYVRLVQGGTDSAVGLGYAKDVNTIRANIPLPVTMRVKPTALEWGATIYGFDGTNFINAPTSITLAESSTSSGNIQFFQSGSVVTYRSYQITLAANGFIAFSAEL